MSRIHSSAHMTHRALERHRKKAMQEAELKLLAKMTPEQQAARKATLYTWLRKWLEEVDAENQERAAKREADERQRIETVEKQKSGLPLPPPRRMKIDVKAG